MEFSAAETVRQARQVSGLTRQQLALLAGVSPSTVLRIEKGQMSPTYEMVSRLLTNAGYKMTTNISPGGDDRRVAQAVEMGFSQADAFDRFKAAGLSSPVQFRDGVRVVRAPLRDMVADLQRRGIEYAVSSLEGFRGVLPEQNSVSFWPVVYVDPSSELPWPSAFGPERESNYILPISERSRAFVETVDGINYMSPDWSVIDVIASPNRQSDIGLSILETQRQRALSEELVA